MEIQNQLQGGFIDDHTNNQKILIIGASGGVSHIACQIARVMNKYIVEICSSQNIEFVKEMGGTASYLFTPAMILRSLKSIIGFGPRYYCINLSSKEENINQMFYILNKGIIKAL
ncbi:unnamed protein product, partial [Rotaria sp. Silwood1]